MHQVANAKKTSSRFGSACSIWAILEAFIGQNHIQVFLRNSYSSAKIRRRSPVRATRCTPSRLFHQFKRLAARPLHSRSQTRPGKSFFFQLVGRVHSQQATPLHNAHPLAVLRLIHIVCGHKGRNTLLHELVDQIPEHTAGGRDQHRWWVRRRNNRRGWCTMAVARARRCRQPTGNSPTNSSWISSIPTWAMTSCVDFLGSTPYIPA